MAQCSEDPVVTALHELIAQVERTTVDLGAAGEQAQDILASRTEGRTWHEIVVDERRPLIIERVTAALGDLGAAGNRLRRAQAQALLREGLGVTEIGRLFGVTHQRVSALLDDVPDDLRKRRRRPR